MRCFVIAGRPRRLSSQTSLFAKQLHPALDRLRPRLCRQTKRDCLHFARRVETVQWSNGYDFLSANENGPAFMKLGRFAVKNTCGLEQVNGFRGRRTLLAFSYRQQDCHTDKEQHAGAQHDYFSEITTCSIVGGSG